MKQVSNFSQLMEKLETSDLSTWDKLQFAYLMGKLTSDSYSSEFFGIGNPKCQG